MKRVWLLAVLLLLTGCVGNTPVFVDMSIERSYAEASWTGTTYSWHDLSARATCVVEADVTAERTDSDGTNVVTLAVRTVLKGDVDKTLAVRDTAWQYGEAERSLCGEPMMCVGHRVVLFLEATDTASYALVDNAALAKFFFDRDGTYHNALLYSQRYCEDIASKGDTQMPILEDMSPKTLDELKALVS